MTPQVHMTIAVTADETNASITEPSKLAVRRMRLASSTTRFAGSHRCSVRPWPSHLYTTVPLRSCEAGLVR
jgi:hypothetical protein